MTTDETAAKTAAPPLARFKVRASLLEAETTYVLTDEALEVWRGDRCRRRVRLGEITALRLGFDPTRLARDRRRALVMTALHPVPAAAALVIPSAHWLGPGQSQSRLSEWSAFMRALMPALRAVQPRALIERGPVAWPYSAAASLGLIGLGFLVLTGTLAILGLPSPLLILIALGLLAVLFPWLRRWLTHNRRRLVDPAAPPAELLPLPIAALLTAEACGGTGAA